ncbi:MAG: 2-(1,2-epoxy-1,2-dihydrophenyl)acetyl-CoA isomerase [Bermanella sp.]|jgi:2-(1,2-epoxy-1,2-dihydrophenyl)acetyl-CoA isomerase|uniref:2-(1,2-epoxy-1,2-dihydrophenyl)acetyl-CoA isomerase PaaG n=1 Tax=Glaciecola sp. 33A TaxID=2057807 RepID=UPI000C3242E3|nr:2-(1,2-epoxy-1,2-dihydrophenyl)acetyl-CoA isomerase PaaG [Glaciecola sp. 33A]PKI02069.1 2-(1,2-epoxy-1,2-dihydrophenyl)acetyl-CoA isomerase [Glaciecola sp. 33A]
MNYSTIQFNKQDGYAVLTLSRPESLNSFNQQMHQEVKDVFRLVRNDEEIRCLLITGAGRAFCAGQDLGDRTVTSSEQAPDLGESVENNYNPLIRAIMTLEKPIVCAVNGVAAGAGASIALACDIVLAAKSASFVQAFSKIGLVPDSGGTFNLPRALGLPRAKALALLGSKISAEQAENWGLIWQSVKDEELQTEALALVTHLACQPTLALGKIKVLLNQSFNNPLHHQLELEKDAMRLLGQTQDYKEGVSAFMEKRLPSFRGK